MTDPKSAVRLRMVETPLSGLRRVKEILMHEVGAMFRYSRFRADGSKLHDLRDKALRLESFGSNPLSLPSRLKGWRETESTDAYATDTPLTELFGNHPKTKVFVVLLSESERPISRSEVARLAGVSETATDRHLRRLEALEIVESIQRPSEPRYQVNTEHNTVRDLAGIERRTLRDLLGVE